MALSDQGIVRKTLRSATALGIVLGVTMAGPALADFPGERWDVPYVQISGGDADQGALTVGLNNANQTYFYGSKPTKMQATVRGPGKVDLKIVDRASGKVIAERRGLSYSGSGAAATQSITNAALTWMDSLSCVGDCAVATSGTAPAVQTAQAPKPAPAAPAAPEKQPEVAAVAPAAPKPKAQPKPQVQAAQPKPVEPTPAAQPSLAAAALPKTTKPAVRGPAEAPAAAKAPVKEPEAPRTPTAAKPSGNAVAAASPTVKTPVKKDPVVASPSLAEPAKPTPAAPKPTGSTKEAAPAVNTGGQDADAVLAALDKKQQEAKVQDVMPGVSLPLPRPENLSPLAESLGATPKPLETVQPDTTIALAEPTASQEAPSTQGSADEDAQVSVGQGSQPAVTAPAAATQEPDRAAQPEAVTPAATEDSPTAGVAEDDPQFKSPTPVARAPQNDTAPKAPDAEVAISSPSVNAASDPEPAAPAAPAEPARPAATEQAEQPSEDTTEQAAVTEPTEPAVNTEAPANELVETDDGDNEQLALVNPTQPVTRPTVTQPEPAQQDEQPTVTAPADDTPKPEAKDDDIEVAAVDPNAAGPTLANARWVGFTPAVYTGSNDKSGAWIAGPFDRKQRQGWITDTATGATTRVTFVWREAGAGGRTATLSRDAAKALGLGQGDVANVAVYLPR